jgi:hypothetical protein
MKRILFLAVFALVAITTNATVITVNNGTVGAGQYTAIQDAVDASQVGDTIYIHGSQTSYGNVTLNKRLVLIGAGHHPKGTQYNFPTTLGTILLSQGNSTTIPTGSIIKGIFFANIYGSGGSLDVNNIVVERCFVSSFMQVEGSGWIIKNNFSDSIYIGGNKNIIISNNYFINFITSSNQPSVIITNNIFLQNFYLSALNYATVTNNIFIKPGNSNFSGTQNTFNKNIMVYADPANFIDYPTANNTGVGNLNTIENQFTETIPLNISLTNSLEYSWRLLETSLGYKYGTDGTNIGVYGGSYQMPNLTGAVNIPQMISLDIQNSVIPKNGTLTIEFKARGQQ